MVVLWATSFTVIKQLLDHHVAAIDVAILRYAIAAPGFALILGRAKGLPGLPRADAIRVAAAGLLVVVGYHVSLNIGTSYTTSGVAALVVALSPGLTLLFAVVLGLDRLFLRHVIGLAVAFAGVAIVVSLGTDEELSRPLLGRHDLLPLTAMTSLVGMIGLAPLVDRSTFDTLGELSTGDLVRVLYLGLVATLAGYIAWNVGLRGLGPTRAVTYTYAISPVAVLAGALVLDEPVTIWLAVGGALAIGGIALAQRAPRREGPAPRAAAVRAPGR